MNELAQAIAKGKHWHVFNFMNGSYVNSFYYSSTAYNAAKPISGTVRYLTNVPLAQQRRKA